MPVQKAAELTSIANDTASVAALITEITAMPATIATAEVLLKVDVNVGDPVTPGPVEVFPQHSPV